LRDTVLMLHLAKSVRRCTVPRQPTQAVARREVLLADRPPPRPVDQLTMR
jgi:hypothetical protein